MRLTNSDVVHNSKSDHGTSRRLYIREIKLDHAPSRRISLLIGNQNYAKAIGITYYSIKSHFDHPPSAGPVVLV